MRLYLVQHGEANSETEDPERSLTVRGEEETRKISCATKRLGIRPSKIYRSGKKRAEQTVSIQRHLVVGKERTRKMGSRLGSQTGNGLKRDFKSSTHIGYHGSDVAEKFTNKYLALKVEERRKMNDPLYGELRAVNRKHFYEIWKKAHQKGQELVIGTEWVMPPRKGEDGR